MSLDATEDNCDNVKTRIWYKMDKKGTVTSFAVGDQTWCYLGLLR
jgi:hypothetical protein